MNTFRVRIANAVPDRDAIDVLVDGYPVRTAHEFGEVNDYTTHEAATYDVAVTDAATDERLHEAAITFEPGQDYTLLVLGQASSVEHRLLADGSS